MDIIERIKKLHALSERNSSTAEAAAAAAKIQELLFTHNLELSKVLGTPGKDPHPYLKNDYIIRGAGAADLVQCRVLFHQIAKANFCYDFYIPNTSKMEVVGQRHNFEAVVYMFEYISGEIRRLALAALQDQAFLRGADKRRYLRGFFEGAVSAVSNKLRATQQQSAQATTESRDLVVVKDGQLKSAVVQFYPRTKFGKEGRARNYGSNSGHADGRAAGSTIAVNRGIGGGGSRTLIG